MRASPPVSIVYGTFWTGSAQITPQFIQFILYGL